MQRNLYFAVITIVAHAYGQSLQSRNSSAASCNVTLPITSGSDANAFVLLPYSSNQTWAVTGQVDTGNYSYSAIVPDPVFLLVWMNSNTQVTSASSQIYNETYLVGPECSKSYSQAFNFTTASKDFKIGVPNRIWWNNGTTEGNVTFHVTTIGAQNGAWDTQTSLIPVANITEMAGQGVGFDWIPSIRPGAAFIITLGDDRGIGSGGSLRGFVNSSPSFLCAYQMSGSYPVLQRLLLYLLFLFGTIGMFTASSWMTGPFLGGGMAYSGSAAIHSIILLASSNKASQKGTIDLDGIPIFQILAVCLYLCAPLYLGSSLLQLRTGDTSATVLVVGAWAILIIVGFFCCIVVDAPQAILPCIPRNITTSIGTTVTIPADTDLCAELCASRSSLIRSLGEAQMNDARVTLHGVFKGLYEVGWFVGMACAIGVTAVIFATIMAPNSGAELAAALSECNDPSRSSSTGRRRRRGRRSNKSDSGPACIIVFILVAAPVALVIQIALGEHLLAKAALASERSYAVGQWGPWVTVGLAFVASVFLLLTSSTRYGPSDDAIET